MKITERKERQKKMNQNIKLDSKKVNEEINILFKTKYAIM